jgi:hypothetical protein
MPLRPNKKIGVVPVTRPTLGAPPTPFFTPSKKNGFNFSTLKCNNMTPNALKMHIREVRFKHFENFKPTHFGFNYSIQIRLFLTMKIPK